MSALDMTTEWIADQLRSHRLQQTDLARALDIAPSGVTRLLSGKRKLRPHEVAVITAFFSSAADDSAGRREALADMLRRNSGRLAWLAHTARIPLARLKELEAGGGLPGSIMEVQAIASSLGETYGPTGRVESNSGDREIPSNRGGWEYRDTWPMEPADRIPIHVVRAAEVDGLRRPELGPVAEYRVAPAPLRGVHGAYGCFVADDAHAPMLIRGDVFYVHPTRPLAEGARVFAKFADGSVQPGLYSGIAGRPRLMSNGTVVAIEPGTGLEMIVAIETH